MPRLEGHIKTGNLYKTVEKWNVRSRSANAWKDINAGETVLILNVVEHEEYNNCEIELLCNGEIIFREQINTPAVNALKLIKCEE